MFLRKIIKISLFLLVFVFLHSFSSDNLLMSQTIDIEVKCNEKSKQTGKSYRVNNSEIEVRMGPGENYQRVINTKATEIFKQIKYVTLNNSVTVYKECSQGKWSYVYVSFPDWLSDTHKGWVLSKYLKVNKTDESGVEVFTEEDFYWDEKTTPYKEIIIAGVNKIHRENSRCKYIDPSSAYLSGSKGTKENPVFYVTCGKGYKSFNVFFSKSDVENDIKLKAAKHINRYTAINLCEEYAKSQAVHPSTVKFSKFYSLSVYETPNGRTRITSTFTAKNSFNLEIKFNIICLCDNNGIIDAQISETE